SVLIASARPLQSSNGERRNGFEQYLESLDEFKNLRCVRQRFGRRGPGPRAGPVGRWLEGRLGKGRATGWRRSGRANLRLEQPFAGPARAFACVAAAA